MAALSLVLLVGVGVRVIGHWTASGAATGSDRPEAITTSAAGTDSGPGGAASFPPASTAPAPPDRADTRDGDPGDSAATAVKITVDTDGPGTFRRISQHRPAAFDRGRIVRYDVREEKGLPFDGESVARKIHAVLSDRRSWAGDGSVRFVQVADAASASLTIYLATPGTTDQLCAPLLTRGRVSCQNGRRVVLNAKRWAFGAKAYGDDVAAYRTYLINHEVGHTLGHQHVGCARQGARAGVMMQQTKGLSGCRANPWPAPGRD